MKTFEYPVARYKVALTQYYNETASLLTANVKDSIEWFYTHYPRRTVKWISGMGFNGFQVDGLCLYHMDKRLLNKLQPLVRVEKEAEAFEDSEYGHFIFTGDIGDPVADKMRLGILTPTY